MSDRRAAIATAIAAFVGLSVLGAFLYRPDLPVWAAIPVSMREGFAGLILMHGITLFWLPMVVILLVLQEPPEKFGFGIGDIRIGKWWGLGLYGAVLPFLIFAARMPNFQGTYPYYCPEAAGSLVSLGYYETAQGLYFFIWEFFFRGFLLFGLARTMGKWSIVVGAILFMLFHAGKPTPEFIASLPTGLILGWVALRCKSFLPAFAVHWAAAASFDLLVLGFSGRL